MKLKSMLILMLGLSLPHLLSAQLLVQHTSDRIAAGKLLEIFVDSTGEMTLEDVISYNRFVYSDKAVPNFQYSRHTIWLRLAIRNQQIDPQLGLEILNSQLDKVTFFLPMGNTYTEMTTGDEQPFAARFLNHQHFVFPFDLLPGNSINCYIRLQSKEQLSLPVYVGTLKAITDNHYKGDLFAGLYLGIMFVMFFYNLFIYFSVRDRSYLFYVMYILGIALAQASLQGFTFKYILPESPELNRLTVVLFSTISGIGAISFARYFLQLRQHLPLIAKSLNLFIGLYVAALLLFILKFEQLSYQILDFSALWVSLLALYFSIKLSLKGLRSARFFLFAWSFFMIGLVVYVGRNFGLLPYTFFTDHVLMIASAVEAVLLSVALADRINTLKREKEISQAAALRISQENEKLVREQNVVLEEKVNERTAALQKSNADLNQTLSELKNTQTQLVNAEKMASLGQLTAGIAHEINNPINFVTSNIRPLRRDVNDLLDLVKRIEGLLEGNDRLLDQAQAIKDELDYNYLTKEIELLISGMEEGAFRTAEIVKGLRTFSRLDESDLKKVNLNEGIDSTLILLNSSMGGRIELVRDYDEDALVECYPGKLNQVFMNILNNAIQAIHSLEKNEKSTLYIRTKALTDTVEVEIRDSGPGMSEEIKARIFEPFFTTKPVGQGTGLGLSIVYSIIESHKGQIRIETAPGAGTAFIITLPKLHQ
jgi:signal transduction histidine kinase